MQVTLGKVLKAIVVMRSLFIDRTIVRGYHENVYSEDGKVTEELLLQSESVSGQIRGPVFVTKITIHLTSLVLASA